MATVSELHKQTIRLLSYNIQVGAHTCRYRHYVTRGWRQLMPNRMQINNLDAISELLRGYDFVGLQEVDGGSFRSGFINQTDYLAARSGFGFCYSRPNRNIGQLAKHSNGFLSRYQPSYSEHMPLPGLPGRGLLLSEFNYGCDSFAIIVVHLALTGRSQKRQLQFLAELSRRYQHCILMGDFNLEPQNFAMIKLLEDSGLKTSEPFSPTFPSWRPHRKLDHILVSRDFQLCSAEVLDYPLSDHLPVQLEVSLPAGVKLAA